jgi:hypothetical protein
VPVTVIQAEEGTPPEGEEGICWVLIPTQRLEDAAQAAQQVRYDAKRWGIERLHYTLKSGLRAERLPSDDARSLTHCLAAYSIVAWRLLYLLQRARSEPEAPAAAVLTAAENAVLTAHSGRKVPTVRQAVVEIARLVGYEVYRTAPPPGVKRLWLGMRRLEGMVVAWRLQAGSLPESHF